MIAWTSSDMFENDQHTYKGHYSDYPPEKGNPFGLRVEVILGSTPPYPLPAKWTKYELVSFPIDLKSNYHGDNLFSKLCATSNSTQAMAATFFSASRFVAPSP